MNKVVIELQNIKRNFQVGDETVHALRGVSFTIREGEFVSPPCSTPWAASILLPVANTCWTALPCAPCPSRSAPSCATAR